MSAVSTPMPTTRASRRTIACGRGPGSRSSFSRRAASISLICSATTRRRAMARRSSAAVFGGRGAPSGVCSASRRSGALRRVGLMPRMPRRARLPFIRFTMRVRSPTRLSRSRFGRRASSSSSVGTAAMLQWSGSPRSQPRKARLSSSVSSRSVSDRRDPPSCAAPAGRPGRTGSYRLRSPPRRAGRSRAGRRRVGTPRRGPRTRAA